MRDTHRSNEAMLSPNTGLHLTARVTRVRQMTPRPPEKDAILRSLGAPLLLLPAARILYLHWDTA